MQCGNVRLAFLKLTLVYISGSFFLWLKNMYLSIHLLKEI